MHRKRPFRGLLGLLGTFLPGDYLKTAFYLNVIARPRRVIRTGLTFFYRMELVYDVLEEAKKLYKGDFSILEFGTADGYAFTKMLYATRYLRMDDRTVVHGFDSFEGLPAPADRRDENVVTGDGWVQGQFPGSFDELDDHCRSRYDNYRLHRGWFNETITDEFLKSLNEHMPILVWIDCDYYSSARLVMERLIPYLPSGCVIYFDDFNVNYQSRFTGEARVVYELNCGKFGSGIELVPDSRLGLNSKRVYRFIRFDPGVQYEKLRRTHKAGQVRRRTNDSILP